VSLRAPFPWFGGKSRVAQIVWDRFIPTCASHLCGYDGEHLMPESWECIAWKANGGYANRKKNTRGENNSRRERIWFSPACVKEGPLFRDIARCEREQGEAAEELRAGHPDRRGLEQCIDDWIMEEALIEAEKEADS
jgi:hypothetical protein